MIKFEKSRKIEIGSYIHMTYLRNVGVRSYGHMDEVRNFAGGSYDHISYVRKSVRGKVGRTNRFGKMALKPKKVFDLIKMKR